MPGWQPFNIDIGAFDATLNLNSTIESNINMNSIFEIRKKIYYSNQKYVGC